jgi:hypothetical protein
MQNRRYIDPYNFGSLMDELFSPMKYGQRAIDHVGTRDKPTIVTRGEWVEKKYKAWREEDGSYHEELIDDSDIPKGAEITNGD